MITNINAVKFSWILIMFGGKYHQENAKNGILERLEARAFSASQLSRLSEKVWLRPCAWSVLKS